MAPDRSAEPNEPGAKIVQGATLAKTLAAERRHTWSRAELAQYAGFDEYSPTVGAFDPAAFRRVMERSDEHLFDALPRLAKAADVPLQRAVRGIAARIVLKEAQRDAGRARGAGRRSLVRGEVEGELDIDASLEAILRFRAGYALGERDLFFRTWRRQAIALCLVVDASGSMGGSRLGSAAIAAAALALRGSDDYSVVAVTDRAMIVKDQGSLRPVERVVDDLLALRSYGWTDLSLGLRAARAQLARSSREKRITILLSDGRWNRGADPLAAARTLDVLHVAATAGRAPACRELAAAGHGRVVEINGPGEIVPALRALLQD